jgi:signal transduction histidine kinase/ActR/RegA family two-component response regulator
VADGSRSFDEGQRAVLEGVAAGRPLLELLESIVALVEVRAPGMICSIVLFDAERRCLGTCIGAGLPAAYRAAIEGVSIGPAAGSCGTAMYRREPVVVSDIATDPLWAAHSAVALGYGLAACWSSPILSPERAVLGTFAMYYRESRAPRDEERAWVAAATHLAAVAILRDRAEQSLRRSEARAQQLARLYAVSSSVNEAIVRTQDTARLYQLACRIAVEQGLARLAWVGLYDEAADRVVPQARYGNDDGYVDGLKLGLRDDAIDRGPTARALRTGLVAVSNDVANDPNFYYRDVALARGFRSCAVFPLKRGERVIGIFAILGATRDFFREEELRVLGAVADDISFAVESAENETERQRLFDALTDRSAQLARTQRLYRARSEVNRAIARARSLQELLDAMSLALVSAGGFGMAWIGECDGASGVVVPLARAGECIDYVDGLRITTRGDDASRGPTGTAIAQGLSYVCNDFFADPRTLPWREAARRAGWRASAAFPVRREEGIWGAINVYAREAGFFGDHETALLGEVAADLSFALDNLDREARRRAVEDALRQREALLRIAGQAARLGGWSLALPARRLAWSEEVCAIHEVPAGFTPSLDESLAFYAPDVRNVVATRLDACMREGTPFDTEAQLITARGRRVWVRIIGYAERDAEGTISRVQGALQDVSERHRLEEQLRQAQKMEAIGQLAGGVAHDFNNVLSVIFSYASLASGPLHPGDPLLADLGEIRKAGQRGAELTRQLLAFSRHQAVSPRVVDVSAVARGVERMLRRLVGAELEFSVLLAEQGAHTLADRGQLEQVLMNLVVNARDAMPRGGRITLETKLLTVIADEARTHPGIPVGPWVVLTVHDTGIGMDATTRSRMFEPFFTTKAKGHGTGLGLSIVYGIVAQSRGHVRVDSEPGRGTTFHIYLPRVSAALDAEIVEDRRVPAHRGDETVLVVEDESQVRESLRVILQRHGYSVVEAQNGGEAILACEQHEGPIHALVTDVVMPRMSGPELAARVAPLRPAMKVLYVSGYMETSLPLTPALDATVAFLPKPIEPDVLLARLRALLDAR